MPRRGGHHPRRGHNLKGKAMSAKPLPSIELLRKNFFYDPRSGEIRRIKGKQPKVNSQGYVCFRFAGQYMAGHRVAWALHYNEQPDPNLEIDHINGNRADNRISNLRLVTQEQNLRNKTKYKNCKHGYPGILFEKDGREKCWRAQIAMNGTIAKLGAFRCKTAAIFARKMAEAKHGFTDLAGDPKWRL